MRNSEKEKCFFISRINGDIEFKDIQDESVEEIIKLLSLRSRYHDNEEYYLVKKHEGISVDASLAALRKYPKLLESSDQVIKLN